MPTDSGCQRLRDLLEAEKIVVLRHLATHKWLNGIPDENHGIMNFVERYGWLMREMYCGYSCAYRLDCRLAKEFLPGADYRNPADRPGLQSSEPGAGPSQPPAGHTACPSLNARLEAQTYVLIRHLNDHKWFRGIPDEAHGRRDFEERYRWLIEEMFCDFACKDRHLCTTAHRAQPMPATLATPASRHSTP